MVTKEEQRKQGKRDRIAGKAFEVKVRADLESKGWIVDRWTNNVSDFPEDNLNKSPDEREDRRLVPASPLVRFSKMGPILMNAHTGFPDFVAVQKTTLVNNEGNMIYARNGIESKMTGKLDKQEKEKCQWLLDENIFSKIFIASKGEKRGQIIYTDFEKWMN